MRGECKECTLIKDLDQNGRCPMCARVAVVLDEPKVGLILHHFVLGKSDLMCLGPTEAQMRDGHSFVFEMKNYSSTKRLRVTIAEEP